jgi:hypothetical protein
VPDWPYTLSGIGFPNGPAWKGAAVVEAYTLSFQNQWFLRGIDGTDIPAAVAGQAPITYEGFGFKSMPISLIEVQNQISPSNGLAFPAQREIGDPATFDIKNVPRIAVPATNILHYQFDGLGAPLGLVAAAWHENPAENTKIEDNFGSMVGVPVPDYFGGGGAITTGGGVYQGRFRTQWDQTTTGPTSLISNDDTMRYSYFLATMGNHLIGYGIGLIDSTFALPGTQNDQSDIMSIAVVFDLSAFIAAGKQFQFVTEDLVRLQDVVNGDFTTPGSSSTLPGPNRP